MLTPRLTPTLFVCLICSSLAGVASEAHALNDLFAPAWGGPGCAAKGALEQVVDDAFADAPAAEFLGNGRGSGAAGYSVALSHPGCGTFRYAVGERDVVSGEAQTSLTYQHIASLTKPLTTSIVLALAEQGAFGPSGLETPVAQFFSAAELELLTVGPDPAAPRCPAVVLVPDRFTREIGPAAATCPDLSQITLRHLLNGNHGLFDSGNEVDRDLNGFGDQVDYAFQSLFEVLGIPHAELPAGADDAFELLAADGLLGNPNATVGGSSLADFEISFGNTGYVLLGLIAERVSGVPYPVLLVQHVSAPLNLLPILSITEVPSSGLPLARMYTVTTGADLAGLPENLFGVYPLVDIAGNPAVDLYDLDNFHGVGRGAEGSGAATMLSYLYFFDQLLGGGFLDPQSRALFDAAYLPLDEAPTIAHGFGVFRFDTELGPVFQKGGAGFGANCDALHLAATRTTAVACANSNDLFIGRLIPGVPPTMQDVENITGRLIQKAVGLE